MIFVHEIHEVAGGKMEDFAAAVRAGLQPELARQHEVVILQRINRWDAFARLLTEGERNAPKGGWMEEGLRYRDKWESKLLRCARWSPLQ